MQVVALHVHHGLSVSADAWLAHGGAQCARWARQGLPVEFFAERLATSPGRGESVEAWARRERYRALRRMAIDQGADLVLLAHHRRDQAETFLLQALRAGSAAALSSMPANATRDGLTWARPWLVRTDAAIDAYVRTHRLRHVVDDSNGDTRLARNRLRGEVWPALLGAFPDAERALAAAATLAQAAASTMLEWAALDLKGIAPNEAIDIAAWSSLPPSRRANALHAWLRMRSGAGAPPRSLVDRLALELDATRTRRWPVPGGELRSYRGTLRFLGDDGPSSTGRPAMGVALPESELEAWNAAGTEPEDDVSGRIDLRPTGVHPVPAWRGAFVVEAVAVGGVSAATAGALQLRRRLPGDRFQAGPSRPPRSLKLQFQSASVAPWLRDGPVLSHGGQVVFVAGLGIDARAIDRSGAPTVRISWRPD